MEFIHKLEKLHLIDSECRHLERAVALLQWDQETYLPEKAVPERAEQLALLEGLIHERLTSDETGRLLSELRDEKLSPLEGDFVKVLGRNHERALKLPADFVTASARAEGLSQAAWVKARQDNNFAYFLPHLVKMIDFARQKAHYWGYGENPYDGLLDIYEPGMGTEAISALFDPLAERLSSLLKKIASRPRPNDSFFDRDFAHQAQASFCAELMQILGFDSSRGRIDVSAHPFCSTLGSDDIRITTRYLKRQVQSAIFSTIHESGHAFYEMGFPGELRGSCLAEGASMGIHESQSRLWENVIGRGRPFWEKLFPLLQSRFSDALSPVSFDDFYRAINLAEPSLIRVEADEVSYSLHVILRFELEKALFSGSLRPEDLPSAWREKMKALLGLEPESDAQGVLQDIHWSMGGFGYFPSYALGNLYGLQFWQKIKSDLPAVDELIAASNFTPIHDWLRDNIYIWGRRLEPRDLLKRVSGNSLSSEPFLHYIESKYAGLYEIPVQGA